MKIVIVAGGTGGHLYPGIAVARGLSGHDILFVVRRGDLCRDILRKEGFAVREISGQGLPRRLSLQLLTFPGRFVKGWLEARSLLKQIQPDWVLGMGGYLSVPVIVLAWMMKYKTLIHEQNVRPGLANRLVSHVADSVAVSFPASLDYFPKGKAWISGLPVRPDMGMGNLILARQHFGLLAQLPTFLIFGGSLGARYLNTVVVEAWALLLAQGLNFQVLHIAGTNDFDRVSNLYQGQKFCAKVMPYCHDMSDAYAAADAIVCRSGASTVAELLVIRRPALLVPYPFATNDHQVDNARMLERAGLGQMVLEKDLNPSTVANFLAKTAKDEEFRHAYAQTAANVFEEMNPRDATSRLTRHLVGR